MGQFTHLYTFLHISCSVRLPKIVRIAVDRPMCQSYERRQSGPFLRQVYFIFIEWLRVLWYCLKLAQLGTIAIQCSVNFRYSAARGCSWEQHFVHRSHPIAFPLVGWRDCTHKDRRVGHGTSANSADDGSSTRPRGHRATARRCWSRHQSTDRRLFNGFNHRLSLRTRRLCSWTAWSVFYYLTI